MGILESIGGLAGGALTSLFGKSAAKKQAQNQVKFAKNAIQWKVEDAKKAGVHPLAALGATTQGYSPVSQSIGDFSQAGQSLGRALDAHMSTGERHIAQLAVEKAGLENEYLRAQIASVRSRIAQTPIPAAPSQRDDTALIAGQGDTRYVTKFTPPEETNYIRTPLGIIVTRPGTSNAQSYEDRYGDIIQEFGGFGNLISDLAHTGGRMLDRYAPSAHWFNQH